MKCEGKSATEASEAMREGEKELVTRRKNDQKERKEEKEGKKSYAGHK